jgi:hypothetical protein
MDISYMLGKTIVRTDLNVGDSEGLFVCSDGSEYMMYHSQDCCEEVYIEDITGDVDDLIGSPLLMAEEVSNYSHEDDEKDPERGGDWTFYKLATTKGYLTIRWLGRTNSCYSLEVKFEQTKLSEAEKVAKDII